MTERKENLPAPTPCDWCGGENPDFQDPYNLRVGAGIFRDYDVYFNRFDYPGIPICGGCGGLGHTFNTEDFKDRTRKIMTLRFQFHPVDDLPEPPSPVIYYSLKDLVHEVRDLVENYGQGVPGSFAQKIVNGYFDNALNEMSKDILLDIENIKNENIENNTLKKATQPGILALWEGKFDEGIEKLERAAADNPTLSDIQHDLGTVFINFKRDAEKALFHFKKSTELEPKRTMNFVDTAKLLLTLKRPLEAIPYLERAQLQEDYDEFVSKTGVNISGLLAKLYNLKNQDNN